VPQRITSTTDNRREPLAAKAGLGIRQDRVVGQFDPVGQVPGVPLRDWLIEFDPNLLRVGGINLYWDGRAGLYAGHMDMIYVPLNCDVVGLVARDYHPKSNPDRELMLAAAYLFHR
jgi:hypothetical protein